MNLVDTSEYLETYSGTFTETVEKLKSGSNEAWRRFVDAAKVCEALRERGCSEMKFPLSCAVVVDVFELSVSIG